MADRITVRSVGARGRSSKQVVIDAGDLAAGATDQEYADWLLEAPVAEVRGDVDASRDTLGKMSDALDAEAAARAPANWVRVSDAPVEGGQLSAG